MRLLLTGASGFLGSHLRDALSHAGHDILALGGRRDLALWEAPAHETLDAVLHAGFEVDFAPAAGGSSESENVALTRRLVAGLPRASHDPPYFVFLSAAGALGVGETDRARNEEDRGRTDRGFESYRGTRYIQDKLTCEILLEGYPGPWCVVYLPTVYGPGMPEGTVRELRRAAGAFPLAVCPPGGTSFLDLRDFLAAVALVLNHRATGRYLISGGNALYRDLYATAARVLGAGHRQRVLRLPCWTRGLAVRAARLSQAGMGSAVVASAYGFKYYSAERIRRDLGWSPRYTLEEALQRAVGSPPAGAGSLHRQAGRLPRPTEPYHD